MKQVRRGLPDPPEPPEPMELTALMEQTAPRAKKVMWARQVRMERKVLLE